MSYNLSSDAEEGRRRATNGDIRDITKDVIDEFNKHHKHEEEGEKYVNMKEPIAVLQSAYGGGDDEWQRILTAMSKGINKEKNEMAFNFEAGSAWNDLSAERAVEIINHLPPSLEELWIWHAPYGSLFMDAVIDLIETSTNLKDLTIYGTCVCGRYVDEGRDAGIKLAKTLAAKNRIIIQH